MKSLVVLFLYTVMNLSAESIAECNDEAVFNCLPNPGTSMITKYEACGLMDEVSSCLQQIRCPLSTFQIIYDAFVHKWSIACDNR
ncbi:hypothetical protein SNE40_016191 [Patella caerulea]|uniref:Uncharacterized protein n=1 Tax=Patella caerulea TaxID=87958 RepID=A0AAN8PMT9_PATCE